MIVNTCLACSPRILILGKNNKSHADMNRQEDNNNFLIIKNMYMEIEITVSIKIIFVIKCVHFHKTHINENSRDIIRYGIFETVDLVRHTWEVSLLNLRD